jgi:prevent-host-death family protein
MTQITVGIREFKARLSRYVEQVKEGATVVITEHGKPVGRVVPIKPSPQEQMQELIEAGLVGWNGHKLSPLTPVTQPQGGQTVAELLLEERE